MKLPIVYFAGPYTSPDPVANTHRAIQVGMDYYDRGSCYPVIPHLSLMIHLIQPRADVEYWYEFDMHILERCDYLYRLKGKSSGADKEVDRAKSLGIPVFYEDSKISIFLFTFACETWKKMHR